MLALETPYEPAVVDGADDLLDIKSTCRYIAGNRKPINRSTLYRGVKSGLWPAPEKVGWRAVRFRKSKLDKAIAKLNSSAQI